MGSMALDGIGGFPTKRLVDGLMALEHKTLIPVKNRKAQVSDQLRAMQALNAKISSISSNAWKILGKETKFSVGDSSKIWGAAKGTSSNDTVEVTAREGAQVGSLTFNVDQVAQTQQSIIKEAELTALSDRIMKSTPPTLSVVVGNKVTTIHPATGSAADMARAINQAKDSGVSATAVRVGDGKYVLQITGKVTGEVDGKVEIYSGDLNARLKGKIAEANKTGKEDSTAVSDAKPKATVAYDKADLIGALGDFVTDKAQMQTARKATDAKITLWAGTDSAQSFSQASNTFKDIIDKVDITIGKSVTDKDGALKSTTPQGVKIDIKSDPSVAAERVRKLVGSINLVAEEIFSQTRPVDKVREDGTTYKAPGVLGSLSIVRQINSSFGDLMSGGVSLDGKNTVSLADVGIKLSGEKDSGKLTLNFDESVFTKALQDDPERVQKVIDAFAKKTDKLSTSYSDSDKGLLTESITSQQNDKKQIEDRLSQMDLRLEMRRKNLEMQFSRLQTILQKNQAQGAWLAGQLANLQGGMR